MNEKEQHPIPREQRQEPEPENIVKEALEIRHDPEKVFSAKTPVGDITFTPEYPEPSPPPDPPSPSDGKNGE